MKKGKASKTALRVAIRRAAHQIIDRPLVLDDPIALRIIGKGHENDLERASHKVARDFRCFMAARSRYAEDRLTEAVARGVRQYVLLGAGLDTFAYRNPHDGLRVFEVDHPATQLWKRRLLAEAEIEEPASLVFVACDFEHKTLAEALAEAGFDAQAPAFFTWLGVVPYLTREAFRATLAVVASLPAGSGVSFDYSFAPEMLSPARRKVFDGLAGRVAAVGEPFRLFFTPEGLNDELTRAGFRKIEQAGSARLNDLYFHDRADGLRLSAPGLGMIATAWV
jgi:methyltransferase (TIGR00027 family)